MPCVFVHFSNSTYFSRIGDCPFVALLHNILFCIFHPILSSIEHTDYVHNPNHKDYKYLQGSDDLWFCICCNEIFTFGALTNKDFLSMMMVNSCPTTAKNKWC